MNNCKTSKYHSKFTSLRLEIYEVVGKGRTIRSSEIQAEYWGGKGKKQSNSYRVDKVVLEGLTSQKKLDKHKERKKFPFGFKLAEAQEKKLL